MIGSARCLLCCVPLDHPHPRALRALDLSRFRGRGERADGRQIAPKPLHLDNAKLPRCTPAPGSTCRHPASARSDCRARTAASPPRGPRDRTRRRWEAAPRRARHPPSPAPRPGRRPGVEQPDDVAIGNARAPRHRAGAGSRPPGRDACSPALWPPKSSWLCSRVAGWLAISRRLCRASGTSRGGSQTGWPGQSA